MSGLLVVYLNLQGAWVVAAALAATGLYFASDISFWSDSRNRCRALGAIWREWRECRRDLREEEEELEARNERDARRRQWGHPVLAV